jgi:hypothetical protein
MKERKDKRNVITGEKNRRDEEREEELREKQSERDCKNVFTLFRVHLRIQY